MNDDECDVFFLLISSRILAKEFQNSNLRLLYIFHARRFEGVAKRNLSKSVVGRLSPHHTHPSRTVRRFSSSYFILTRYKTSFPSEKRSIIQKRSEVNFNWKQPVQNLNVRPENLIFLLFYVRISLQSMQLTEALPGGGDPSSLICFIQMLHLNYYLAVDSKTN